MHLLVFGVRWPADTFIQAKLERLAASGVQVTVACADSSPKAGGPVVRGVRVERVIATGSSSSLGLVAAVLRLAVTRPHRLHALWRAAHAPTADGRNVGRREGLGRLRMYARLTSLRPDLVHFEWNTAAVHYHSLVEALDCPSVVSVRGGDLEVHPHSPATARLTSGYQVAFATAALVHCVSEAAQAEAARHGVRPGKARVIRPAVDCTRFPPPSTPRRPDGTFRIVGVGWLHWRKGWEDALQAIAHLVAAGVPARFDLVGPEPSAEMVAPADRRRILHTIDDLGLGDRVKVHGALAHDDVRKLLEKSDVLLHTSLAEGIPNVVLEAMACGLPVVATDVGGTSEAVTDGVEGVLVPPRAARAAAEGLAALWRDADGRNAMGAAGRARVETAFDLDRQTERWLEVYEEALDRGVRARGLRIAEIGVDLPLETYLRRRLQGLAERGAEVTIASIVPPGSRPQPLPGARLERLPHWTEPRHRALSGLARDAVALLITNRAHLRELVGTWKALPRTTSRREVMRLHLRLARLRADVAHFEWASFAELCAPLFRIWDFPVVVSCHGGEVLVHPSNGSPVDLPALFRRVDLVHCVSQAVQRAAVAQGLDGTPVEVIPSSVDPAIFRPARRVLPPDRELVVVTIGGLRWVKGYEHALAAIARLVEAGVPVRYEIVGDEPADVRERGERARIVATVEDLGLGGRVRLHGRLSELEVTNLLRSADVYLQTSLSEGMPTAVLEAMACALPVVATDVGGTHEAFSDGVEGYLVPARDSRAVAAALTALWRDPDQRRAMGAAGRARVETELTLEQQLDEFESMYRELVGT
jgi:glycosyltransferase involved in cell wall biosynthesis